MSAGRPSRGSSTSCMKVQCVIPDCGQAIAPGSRIYCMKHAQQFTPEIFAPDHTRRISTGASAPAEYKNMRMKISLVDNTVKTVMIGEKDTVQDVLDRTGPKFGVADTAEFGLALIGLDGKERWLPKNRPVAEFGITDDSLVVFKKKLFLTDWKIRSADGQLLHVHYVQARQVFLSGGLGTWLINNMVAAVRLAALLARLSHAIEVNEYGVSQFNANLENFFPDGFMEVSGHKSEMLREWVTADHEVVAELSDIDASYDFFNLCREQQLYGCAVFTCQMDGPDGLRPVDLCVSRAGLSYYFVTDVVPEFHRVPVTNIKRWTQSAAHFVVDTGDYTLSNGTSMLIFQTREGRDIADLLDAYITSISEMRTPDEARWSIQEDRPLGYWEEMKLRVQEYLDRERGGDNLQLQTTDDIKVRTRSDSVDTHLSRFSRSRAATESSALSPRRQTFHTMGSSSALASRVRGESSVNSEGSFNAAQYMLSPEFGSSTPRSPLTLSRLANEMHRGTPRAFNAKRTSIRSNPSSGARKYSALALGSVPGANTPDAYASLFEKRPGSDGVASASKQRVGSIQAPVGSMGGARKSISAGGAILKAFERDIDSTILGRDRGRSRASTGLSDMMTPTFPAEPGRRIPSPGDKQAGKGTSPAQMALAEALRAGRTPGSAAGSPSPTGHVAAGSAGDGGFRPMSAMPGQYSALGASPSSNASSPRPMSVRAVPGGAVGGVVDRGALIQAALADEPRDRGASTASSAGSISKNTSGKLGIFKMAKQAGKQVSRQTGVTKAFNRISTRFDGLNISQLANNLNLSPSSASAQNNPGASSPSGKK